MPHRIAEVAELTGVPATAIRYYEDEGLIPPAARAPNGYRIFGDRDVARLRFVRRARNLDLPVSELRDLVALWDDDDCAVVAGRMHDRVTRRLRDTQQKIADLVALAGDLQVVQARLQDVPHVGPCHDHCVCLDAAPSQRGQPIVAATREGAESVARTLDEGAHA